MIDLGYVQKPSPVGYWKKVLLLLFFSSFFCFFFFSFRYTKIKKLKPKEVVLLVFKFKLGMQEKKK